MRGRHVHSMYTRCASPIRTSHLLCYRLRRTLYTRCTSTLTLARLTPHERKWTWRANGGDIGGLGGGSLEHPRPWLGAQWAGLSLWECRAAQSRQARPEEAQEPEPEPEPGHCREARLTVLAGEQLVQVVLAGPVVARVRVELLQHAVADDEGAGGDARPAREEGRVVEGASCLAVAEQHLRGE